MQTDQIIEKTIEYLHTGWTQGNPALDGDEEPCDAEDPEAVAWCLTGAMTAAMASLGLDRDGTKKEQRLFTGACYRVAFAAGCADDDVEGTIVCAVERWNDHDDRTTEDVILACKMALAGG